MKLYKDLPEMSEGVIELIKEILKINLLSFKATFTSD